MLGDLNRKEDCSDLKSRAPFVLQNVQADSAQLVNVGVVDTGDKSDLRNKQFPYVFDL